MITRHSWLDQNGEKKKQVKMILMGSEFSILGVVSFYFKRQCQEKKLYFVYLLIKYIKIRVILLGFTAKCIDNIIIRPNLNKILHKYF